MQCTIQLDGYSGKGPELVRYEVTATGLRVILAEPLATEILKGMRGSGAKLSIK